MLRIANSSARIYITKGVQINPGINEFRLSPDKEKALRESPGFQRRVEDGIFIILGEQHLSKKQLKELGQVSSKNGEVEYDINRGNKSDDEITDEDIKLKAAEEEARKAAVNDQANADPAGAQGLKGLKAAEVNELALKMTSITDLETILKEDDRKTVQAFVKARIEELKAAEEEAK